MFNKQGRSNRARRISGRKESLCTNTLMHSGVIELNGKKECLLYSLRALIKQKCTEKLKERMLESVPVHLEQHRLARREGKKDVSTLPQTGAG